MYFLIYIAVGCNKLIADGAQILYDTIQIKEMIPKKDD